MERPGNLKVGDKFVVVVEDVFTKGSIVELWEDDGLDCPQFRLISGRQIRNNDRNYYEDFDFLEPYEEKEALCVPEDKQNTHIVEKPSHYQLLPGVEVMDITEAVLDKIDASDMEMTSTASGWLQQALQYLLRCHAKGGIEDIEKAHRVLGYALDHLRKKGLLE